MKQSFTLLALTIAVLSSCTSAYKTGQTPDDVYYSPARKAAEYVQVEQRDEQPVQRSEDYYEDRFLRMRVEDRYRWSTLDDYYFSNAYAYNSFGNYYSLSSPWNSYYAWNCHYNPYYGGIPYYPGGVIITKSPRIYTPPSRALVFNPASYSVGGNSSSSTISKGLNNSYYNRYNNTNSNRNSRNSLGESIRKVFTNNDNSGSYNSGSNSSTPSRSYSPSSSGSSGGGGRSSGGGGGGGVSRPSR
jgi:uncharacterized membrane protein YgcG